MTLLNDLIEAHIKLINQRIDQVDDAIVNIGEGVIEAVRSIRERFEENEAVADVQEQRIAELEQETADHCVEIGQLFQVVGALSTKVFDEPLSAVDEEEEGPVQEPDEPQEPDLRESDLRL
jgi:uncharacterized coiled-coil protein SlyX